MPPPGLSLGVKTRSFETCWGFQYCRDTFVLWDSRNRDFNLHPKRLSSHILQILLLAGFLSSFLGRFKHFLFPQFPLLPLVFSRGREEKRRYTNKSNCLCWINGCSSSLKPSHHLGLRDAGANVSPGEIVYFQPMGRLQGGFLSTPTHPWMLTPSTLIKGAVEMN